MIFTNNCQIIGRSSLLVRREVSSQVRGEFIGVKPSACLQLLQECFSRNPPPLSLVFTAVEKEPHSLFLLPSSRLSLCPPSVSPHMVNKARSSDRTRTRTLPVSLGHALLSRRVSIASAEQGGAAVRGIPQSPNTWPCGPPRSDTHRPGLHSSGTTQVKRGEFPNRTNAKSENGTACRVFLQGRLKPTFGVFHAGSRKTKRFLENLNNFPTDQTRSRNLFSHRLFINRDSKTG